MGGDAPCADADCDAEGAPHAHAHGDGGDVHDVAPCAHAINDVEDALGGNSDGVSKADEAQIAEGDAISPGD